MTKTQLIEQKLLENEVLVVGFYTISDQEQKTGIIQECNTGVVRIRSGGKQFFRNVDEVFLINDRDEPGQRTDTENETQRSDRPLDGEPYQQKSENMD